MESAIRRRLQKVASARRTAWPRLTCDHCCLTSKISVSESLQGSCTRSKCSCHVVRCLSTFFPDRVPKYAGWTHVDIRVDIRVDVICDPRALSTGFHVRVGRSTSTLGRSQDDQGLLQLDRLHCGTSGCCCSSSPEPSCKILRFHPCCPC